MFLNPNINPSVDLEKTPMFCRAYLMLSRNSISKRSSGPEVNLKNQWLVTESRMTPPQLLVPVSMKTSSILVVISRGARQIWRNLFSELRKTSLIGKRSLLKRALRLRKRRKMTMMISNQMMMKMMMEFIP